MAIRNPVSRALALLGLLYSLGFALVAIHALKAPPHVRSLGADLYAALPLAMAMLFVVLNGRQLTKAAR